MDYKISPIGVMRSCFKDKFGVPRQPGMVSAAKGVIELSSEYGRPEAVRGLEEFSHIWVLFWFHQAQREQWKPTVRPPRLGGNQRLGVFSTRSPFRPNPIGMSVVELERVELGQGKVRLHVKGLDLIDETPVIDIKPYLTYVDAVPTAQAGFAGEAPRHLKIEFLPEAQEQCIRYQQFYPDLYELICQSLALDPRPAYSADEDRVYGIRLYDFDVRWQVRQESVLVLKLLKIFEE